VIADYADRLAEASVIVTALIDKVGRKFMNAAGSLTKFTKKVELPKFHKPIVQSLRS
jgi:hypothetical protein